MRNFIKETTDLWNLKLNAGFCLTSTQCLLWFPPQDVARFHLFLVIAWHPWWRDVTLERLCHLVALWVHHLRFMCCIPSYDGTMLQNCVFKCATIVCSVKDDKALIKKRFRKDLICNLITIKLCEGCWKPRDTNQSVCTTCIWCECHSILNRNINTILFMLTLPHTINLHCLAFTCDT